MMFSERLNQAQIAANSLVCVGLDPDLDKLPADLRGDPQPLFAFGRRVIDATFDIAAAYKPQIAFYSAVGDEAELAASIRYIRERAPAALVILDAKRGDVGHTARRTRARRSTVMAPMRSPSIPTWARIRCGRFLRRPDRGAVLLCRTSNPGARDFQDLLDRRGASLPAGRRARRGAMERASELDAGGGRDLPPRNGRAAARASRTRGSWFPGSERRLATSTATLAAGLDGRGAGLLISSSRAIIYAGGGESAAIRAAAQALHAAINRGRCSRRYRPQADGRRGGQGPQPRGRHSGIAAERDAILAGCLGFVQRGIGSAVNRSSSRRHPVRLNASPKLPVKRSRPFRGGERLTADLIADPLRDIVKSLLIDIAETEHGELLASQPRGHVGGIAQLRHENFPERAQDLIADLMAVMIVNVLEIIEVHQNEAVGFRDSAAQSRLVRCGG